MKNTMASSPAPNFGVGLAILALPMLWVTYLTFFPPIGSLAYSSPIALWDFGETTWWYILINLGTILFPFLLSFDKKVAYYKHWRAIFPAIAIVGGFFLVWDVYFTHLGIWGFNERYYYTTIFGLPVGEWLFFLTVPYACIFIHACLKAYIPNIHPKKWDKTITFSIIGLSFLIFVLNWDKVYTAWTFGLLAVFMALHYFYVPNTYRTQFYISYLISLIPFLLVNGILTGAFTEEPVVLYNEAHNLVSVVGFRCITIPWDDFGYSFLLLMMNITVYEWFMKK